MKRTAVGILGLGSYLPSQVRTNDFWPQATVDRWSEQARNASRPPEVTSLPPGRQRVFAALGKIASDPFKGARERRVLQEDMLPSDAETLAAREALADAGVEAGEVDLLLSSSFVPDVLSVPNAFAIQRNLKIGGRCFVTGIEAGCNAFPMQVALAEQMIASGQARTALLVQSSVLSRTLPMDEPFSTYFGDGAAAVVLGQVSAERGILGRSHHSDANDCGGLITSVPGKRWYEEGRCTWHHGDKKVVFEMLLKIPDIAEEAIGSALAQAGIARSEVNFFACHQGTPWFREVVADHLGLANAKTLDTFSWAGSLIGANVALVLQGAVKDGMIRDGDLVLTFASGVGSTWSAILMRWGR